MFFKEKSILQEMYYIDNHTHGAFGINFNYATYDEVKFILKELFKRNIRGICPTLIGESVENIQKQLKIFKKIKEEQLNSISDECFLIGIHLEGSFLSKNKAGIQNPNMFLKPSIENFKKLVGEFEDIIKIVTIAPEEDIDLIEYLNLKNIISQAGHTVGENIKKCKGVTHLFNAMNSIHHRNKSILLESLIDDNVYVEIIGDLIHLNKEVLKLVLKTKPLDKIILISDSLPVASFGKSIVFCDKKIDKNGKDENGVLAGSIKLIDEISNNLIKKNILTKDNIRQFAFENNIKYLKLSNKEIDILNR